MWLIVVMVSFDCVVLIVLLELRVVFYVVLFFVLLYLLYVVWCGLL